MLVTRLPPRLRRGETLKIGSDIEFWVSGFPAPAFAGGCRRRGNDMKRLGSLVILKTDFFENINFGN
jgi:hypothetical protein